MSVQGDFEAAVQWSTTRDLGNGFWAPGVGGRLNMARMILPRGGLVEYWQPVSQIFFQFWPAAGRTIDGWLTRKDRATSWATYDATSFAVFMGSDPGDSNTWGGSSGFSNPNYPLTLRFNGPCYIEDMIYA